MERRLRAEDASHIDNSLGSNQGREIGSSELHSQTKEDWLDPDDSTLGAVDDGVS